VLQIGIGIWAKSFDESVVKNALTIAGFSAGLLLGIFALGTLTRRAGAASALIGGAIGLGVLSVVQFGSAWHGIKVAFPWLALIGAATTFIVGSVVAWIRPQQGART
jgi:hypothetical protein